MCCLLIQNLQVNSKLKRDYFDRMWNDNPHGCGVGYWRGNEAVINTTMDRNLGWKMYEHAIKEVENDFCCPPKQPKFLIVHCRVASFNTPKVRSNCHPFFAPVGKDGLIVAHNGLVRYDGFVRQKEWSDTRTFVEKWLPENVTDPMEDKKDIEKVFGQLVDHARLVILSQFAARTFNFPTQWKQYQEYGTFSNFGWTIEAEPEKRKAQQEHERRQQAQQVQHNPSQNYAHDFNVLKFQEQPWQNKEDIERWGPGGQYKQKYMSPNAVHRTIMYCIKENVSLAGAMLLFKRLFNEFPSHRQINDFTEHYKDALDAISEWYEEPATKVPMMTPLDIFQQPYYPNSDKLLDAWMEEQGIVAQSNIIEPPKPVIVTQETIEEERAQQNASSFPVDPDFPFGAANPQHQPEPEKTQGGLFEDIKDPPLLLLGDGKSFFSDKEKEELEKQADQAIEAFQHQDDPQFKRAFRD